MTISSRSKKLADSATTRSPIKGSITRQAGQSLREQLDEYVDDNVLLAVLPLGFMLFWLFIELVGRFSNQRTSLWLIGTLVLLSVINFVIRITIIKRKAKLMKQGLCGERYVAQIIGRDLIPKGYKVFHDIEFEKGKRRFNIDHLLIGRNGIFCIETKTWSKPMRGETVAVFDGEKILINGKERQHGVIGQVRALSNEASLQIKKMTGLSVSVIPVVVVVGWFVRKGWSGIPKALVVNEEALAPFVENVQGNLTEDCIERIVQQVSAMNSLQH